MWSPIAILDRLSVLGCWLREVAILVVLDLLMVTPGCAILQLEAGCAPHHHPATRPCLFLPRRPVAIWARPNTIPPPTCLLKVWRARTKAAFVETFTELSVTFVEVVTITGTSLAPAPSKKPPGRRRSLLPSQVPGVEVAVRAVAGGARHPPHSLPHTLLLLPSVHEHCNMDWDDSNQGEWSASWFTNLNVWLLVIIFSPQCLTAWMSLLLSSRQRPLHRLAGARRDHLDIVALWHCDIETL